MGTHLQHYNVAACSTGLSLQEACWEIVIFAFRQHNFVRFKALIPGISQLTTLYLQYISLSCTCSSYIGLNSIF